MENFKTIILIVLAIFLAVGVYQYISVWSDLEQKLEAANALKADLETSRKELTLEVSRLKSEQTGLEQKIAEKQKDIDGMRDQIDTLEKHLKESRFGTLAETNEQATANSFKQKYSLSDPSIQVREFPLVDRVTQQVLTTPQGNTIKEPFIVIPVDYIKLAIDAKDTASTCEKQKDLLEKISTLETDKFNLLEKINQLEAEKTKNYLNAYEEAYKSFETIHQNYTELLKAPPKVELAPNWLQFLSGVVGGAIICGI